MCVSSLPKAVTCYQTVSILVLSSVFKVLSWYVFCISYFACILCSKATVRAHLSLVCLVQLPGLLCYRTTVLLLLNEIIIIIIIFL